MVRQSFNPYMIGSDVDPYRSLGLTRLFIVFFRNDHYYLQVASGVNTSASFSLFGAQVYPRNADGILRMYQQLANSSVFPQIKYCYIPGSVIGATPHNATNLVPTAQSNETLPSVPLPFENAGYDSDTGIRVVATGSAIAQVVPVAHYLSTQTEQVYSPDPTIIPVANSLVYNISANPESNTLFLPFIYTLDSPLQSDYFVTRNAIDQTLRGGQTALFSGGPGGTANTTLTTKSAPTTKNIQGEEFTTYAFNEASVVTIGTTFQPKVNLGVYALTYSPTVALFDLFSEQRIIGWYCKSDWTNCGGVPIYDFGDQNANFLSFQSSSFQVPFQIYDPSHSNVNGGSLRKALENLSRAKNMPSQDTLFSALKSAQKTPADQGGGLSVLKVGLNINFSPPEGALNFTAYVYRGIKVPGCTGEVYLASAVIELTSSTEPAKVVLGHVRTIKMANVDKLVFVPVDDSVLIGKTRYTLSVINIASIDTAEFDPNTSFYPPIFWPQSRYWQFANRHNPYFSVSYTGDTQTLRITNAKKNIDKVKRELVISQEPIHMFLDTKMTMQPIYPNPSDVRILVDAPTLGGINSEIMTNVDKALSLGDSNIPIPDEIITIPLELKQTNQYLGNVVSKGVGSNSITAKRIEPVITGSLVTNLTANTLPTLTANTLHAQQSLVFQQKQIVQAQISESKVLSAVPGNATSSEAVVVPTLFSEKSTGGAAIYGFSIYQDNEAYIIEAVATETHYVRVIFLDNLTSYGMSIIVPSMVYDQSNVLAHQQVAYRNRFSRANDLTLGYLYDEKNDIDLNFNPPAPGGTALPKSKSYLFSNIPYLAAESTVFFCRRQNPTTDTYLMYPTKLPGTSVYRAFGGGDFIPLSLDPTLTPTIDKRPPAHMYQLTYKISDKPYETVKIVRVNNIPICRSDGARSQVEHMQFFQPFIQSDHRNGGPATHFKPPPRVSNGVFYCRPS